MMHDLEARQPGSGLPAALRDALPPMDDGAGERDGVVAGSGRDVRPAAGVVRAGKPVQVIALVPYLLRFQPEAGDLVIMGAVPPRYRVQVTLRLDMLDMPAPLGPAGQAMQARSATMTLAANGCTIAVVVGYGSDPVVRGFAAALREAAKDAGITITEIVRVDGQRWWSLACRAPGCCPSEGTALDPVPDAAIAEAYEAAGYRVMASRGAIAASIAPVTGDGAVAMQAAARRAAQRAARLARRADQPRRQSARQPVVISGIRAVTAATRAYQGGGSTTSPEQVAWLARVLAEPEVREAAWLRMDPAQRDAHRRLWVDVTRRAQPGQVAAPACLLAFVAWQDGNGALARLALDRAEADCSGYALACVLRRAIESGVPPPLGSPLAIWSRLRSGRWM